MMKEGWPLLIPFDSGLSTPTRAHTHTFMITKHQHMNITRDNCVVKFPVAGKKAQKYGRNARWAMIDVLKNPKKAQTWKTGLGSGIACAWENFRSLSILANDCVGPDRLSLMLHKMCTCSTCSGSLSPHVPTTGRPRVELLDWLTL